MQFENKDSKTAAMTCFRRYSLWGNEIQQWSDVLIHPAVMCEELLNQFENLAAEAD
jgi:hypothetical protein